MNFKIIIALFYLFILSSAHALTIEFIGPCSKTSLYKTQLMSADFKNAGELTVAVLTKARIPFQGTASGLNQVYQSPIGEKAMEIVSSQEMFAYGWCIEVDGVIPEVYPDSIELEGVKKIRWFYGFARYFNGEWVSQCEKSYERKSPFICRNL